MAIAKKCDRCGLYYDPYNCENDAEKINAIKLMNIYFNSYDIYFSHGPYDLCPACSNDFMKWFKKENKND